MRPSETGGRHADRQRPTLLDAGRPAGKYARYELERRYLLDRVPEGVAEDSSRLIVDRYIVGTRLRLRRQEMGAQPVVYKLSQKEAPSPPDYSVTTITTIYLARGEYELLVELPANELRKRRCTLHHGGAAYSIDVFDAPFAGLVLAEITFENTDAMNRHQTPPFAVRDVSEDVRLTGAALAETAAALVGAGSGDGVSMLLQRVREGPEPG